MTDAVPGLESGARLQRPLLALLLLAGITLLSACGGGSSSSGSGSSSSGSSSSGSSSSGSSSSGSSGSGGQDTPPLGAPQNVTLNLEPVKTFRFGWTDVEGATHYKLLEDPDGVSGYSQVGGDVPQGAGTVALEVPLYARVNARYIVQACSVSDCVDGDPVSVDNALSDTLVEGIGYFKAGNADPGDRFGHAVALSADGGTLAVGAHFEGSDASGIDGDQDNNEAENAGAVYVFVRGEKGWQPQAYIKASNAEKSDQFGHAVALSADGDTLVVAANGEDSDAIGINSEHQGNADGIDSAGAVYVFARDEGGGWHQQAYVKASNTGNADRFGSAIALSADGDTLAVGATGEASDATGINHENQGDAPGFGSAGAVYVFARDEGADWRQQAYVKASNTGAGDEFGAAVALSADGDTLAVGAHYEDSDATDIGGDQGNVDGFSESGAVYVFVRDAVGGWDRQAYVKASNTGGGDRFGHAVALSADGRTLAVGAHFEGSDATVINGDATNDDADKAGAVYVFALGENGWEQQAYVKANNARKNGQFGFAVALSADGDTLVAGAQGDNSDATGINGIPENHDEGAAGAAYVFARRGGVWQQQAYVKASNTGDLDLFGSAVAVSADGNTLAVGAGHEDGTGIGGDEVEAEDAGAVYLY